MKRISIILLSLLALSMTACSFGGDGNDDTTQGTFVNPHYETEAEVCRVHDLVDGICQICGADMPESQGLQYELTEDGAGYAVTGLGTCTDTQILIPAEHDSLPVVSVTTMGESVDVTNVVIGENVTSIQSYALSGLTSLKGLTVPPSLTTLPVNAFAGLPIQSVILPEGLTEISYGMFQNCGSLRSIHIPSTVTVIGDMAFSDCRLLREVNFPDGLVSIGSSAFKGIVNLPEITLPATLQAVGNGAFDKCENLKTVRYSGDIATWCAIQFEMNGNPLVNGADFYVSGEKVVDLIIPEGVNKPGEFTFQGCGSIERVVCPASMTELSVGMFMSCKNIKEAVFLGEITVPGVLHFAGCEALTNIYVSNSEGDGVLMPAAQFSTGATVHYQGSWELDENGNIIQK